MRFVDGRIFTTLGGIVLGYIILKSFIKILETNRPGNERSENQKL